MAQTIREVMTRDPRTVDASAPISDAAKTMRDADIGSVIVTESDKVAGIVTDRDVTIRAVATDLDPKTTPVREICSNDPVSLSADDSIAEAIELMRQHDVRRVPVVENGRPAGIVSLGDLAVERDPNSVLGDISAAQPNR